MVSNKEDNRHANRALLFITLTGILPLLIIFTVFLHDQNAPLMRFICDYTQKIPSVTSAFNPVMTKVMDIYGKSAPLLGVITFFILYKRKSKAVTDRSTLIRACLFSPFIYSFFIYFFLLRSLELTTAGRPIRWMSENNFTLLIFYICLYYASFLLTYMMCYLPSLAHALWKERQ